MSRQLEQNIYRMRNEEIIGLAKNRWLPANIQMAIAKFGYRRAHEYLTRNEGLSTPVRDYLWSDECNKGYVLKSDLIAHGHYHGSPEKYTELYNRYKKRFKKSMWRLQITFLTSWGPNTNGATGTPSTVLESIYEDFIANQTTKNMDTPRDYFIDYHFRRLSKGLTQHKNCSLPLAVKISTIDDNAIRRIAFQKIAELS